MKRSLLRAVLVSVGISAASMMLIPALSWLPGSEAQALPAWSRKYDVNCAMCHAPTFARLNYFGERFLANGYQHPDSPPDGATEGKKDMGDNLSLDETVGNWFSARFNVTPIQYTTHAQTINGESSSKLVLGNPNWLQLFVAGSINKNLSVYIENEFAAEYHQAWYYMGIHNLGGSSWLNAQVGRLSAVVFAPYPDRLPQLPAVAGGVMRIKSSDGKGESSIDMRSPRNGIQYYGYSGPLTIYAGVTPGSKTANVGNKIGYWAGAKVYLTEAMSKSLAGSAIGLHYDAGTDTKDSPTLQIENPYTRIMPSVTLRYADKLDVQAAYVMATEDNWTLTPADKPNDYTGARVVGSYFVNPKWVVSTHYDTYSADDKSLLPDYSYLYLPVITFIPKQNVRVSLYPGLDMRDVDSDLKQNTIFLNVRMAM